jgi:hypothetical protein
LSDQTSVVDARVSSVSRETITPLIVVCTVGSGERTRRVQPNKTVWVGDPVSDRDGNSDRAKRLSNSGIALNSLRAERVTSNNNLLDVGEVVLVAVPRNKLVKNLIRRDGLSLVGVLVGTAASPLRCLPNQQVRPRLVTTSCLLLSTRRVVPVRV